MGDLIHNDDISANDGSKEIVKKRDKTINELSDQLTLSSRSEAFGLFTMLIASVLAAVVLFAEELSFMFS